MKPDSSDEALSQAYRNLETPAPPAALDAAILAAAREAVQPSATIVPFPARPRRNWTLPLGLAASLVLAVGLSWQLQQRGEGQLDQAAETALPPAAAPVPEPKTEAEASHAFGKMEMAPSPAPLPESEAAPTAAPAPAMQDKTPQTEQQLRPPTASAVKQAVPAPGFAAPPAPPAAPPAPPPAPAAAMEFVPAAPAAASSPAPLLPQTENFAPKPQAARAASKPAEAVSVTGSAIQRTAPAAAHGEAGKAREEETRLLKRQGQGLAAPLAVDAGPEAAAAMLREVRRLLAERGDAEARALLKQLHEQWPDYPLPTDLQPLLDEPRRER